MGPAELPAGRITVVTDEPLEVVEHPGALAQASDSITHRRWLPPALILGLVAAYLLARHR